LNFRFFKNSGKIWFF